MAAAEYEMRTRTSRQAAETVARKVLRDSRDSMQRIADTSLSDDEQAWFGDVCVQLDWLLDHVGDAPEFDGRPYPLVKWNQHMAAAQESEREAALRAAARRAATPEALP